eukprot:17421-Heterococcus_DN1.PRE.6
MEFILWFATANSGHSRFASLPLRKCLVVWLVLDSIAYFELSQRVTTIPPEPASLLIARGDL